MERRYRLLREADFKNALNSGNKILLKHFVCYWLKSHTLKNAQLSIIIPRKKCKLACNRKYLKRVFWSLNTKQILKAFPKVKCVFFYRDSFYEKYKNKKLNFDDLRTEYVNLLIKLSREIN